MNKRREGNEGTLGRKAEPTSIGWTLCIKAITLRLPEENRW